VEAPVSSDLGNGDGKGDGNAGPTYVGIDLGGTKLFGALVDAAGNLHEETYVEHGAAAVTPSASASLPGGPLSDQERALGPAYSRLVELAADLVARSRRADRAAAGVGVGAPGLTRPDGTVIAAGALGWRDVPLGPLLQRRVGVPVRIENDVNLAALGEHAFGAGRGMRSLFVMAIGTGIGGAVVMDGRLWRGARFAAGEVGHLVPGPQFLDWNDTAVGAFESRASGTGIHQQALRFAAAAGLADTSELKGERLFAAALRGSVPARQALDQAVDLWTVAIGAAQSILDPDLVVISGGVAASAAPFLPGIAERLQRMLPIAPRIALSTLGYRAAVLGAPSLFRD
jgi:predicted NBD/HSP70 family sugar kinase